MKENDPGLTPVPPRKKGQRAIPRYYRAGDRVYIFVEREGPWAIYSWSGATADSQASVELVRTTVKRFPPDSDSWGRDGFSFTASGSLERARNHLRKMLSGMGRK